MSIGVIDNRSAQLVLQPRVVRVRREIAPTSRHGTFGIHFGGGHTGPNAVRVRGMAYLPVAGSDGLRGGDCRQTHSNKKQKSRGQKYVGESTPAIHQARHPSLRQFG